MWDQNWVCLFASHSWNPISILFVQSAKIICYNRVANHREIRVLSFPRGTDYACTMRKGPGHSLWHCRDTSLAEEPLCIFFQHNVLPMPLFISYPVLDVTLGLGFVILFSVILFGHLIIITSKGCRLETKIEVFTPPPRYACILRQFIYFQIDCALSM